MKKGDFMEIVEPIRSKQKIFEMKKNLSEKSQRDYFLFVIGINTGLRISDILNLKIEDIKDKDFIRIREKKTGKEKLISINNNLKEEIAKYIKDKKESDFLFQSKAFNNKTVNKPLSRISAYRILNQSAKEIGLQIPIGTHTLRKTFGYHFYQNTKDIALLQEIFNHSSASITLKYIGINQDMISKAYDNFSL